MLFSKFFSNRNRIFSFTGYSLSFCLTFFYLILSYVIPNFFLIWNNLNSGGFPDFFNKVRYVRDFSLCIPSNSFRSDVSLFLRKIVFFCLVIFVIFIFVHLMRIVVFSIRLPGDFDNFLEDNFYAQNYDMCLGFIEGQFFQKLNAEERFYLREDAAHIYRKHWFFPSFYFICFLLSSKYYRWCHVDIRNSLAARYKRNLFRYHKDIGPYRLLTYFELNDRVSSFSHTPMYLRSSYFVYCSVLNNFVVTITDGDFFEHFLVIHNPRNMEGLGRFVLYDRYGITHTPFDVRFFSFKFLNSHFTYELEELGSFFNESSSFFFYLWENYIPEHVDHYFDKFNDIMYGGVYNGNDNSIGTFVHYVYNQTSDDSENFLSSYGFGVGNMFLRRLSFYSDSLLPFGYHLSITVPSGKAPFVDKGAKVIDFRSLLETIKSFVLHSFLFFIYLSLSWFFSIISYIIIFIREYLPYPVTYFNNSSSVDPTIPSVFRGLFEYLFTLSKHKEFFLNFFRPRDKMVHLTSRTYKSTSLYRRSAFNNRINMGHHHVWWDSAYEKMNYGSRFVKRFDFNRMNDGILPFMANHLIFRTSKGGKVVAHIIFTLPNYFYSFYHQRDYLLPESGYFSPMFDRVTGMRTPFFALSKNGEDSVIGGNVSPQFWSPTRVDMLTTRLCENTSTSKVNNSSSFPNYGSDVFNYSEYSFFYEDADSITCNSTGVIYHIDDIFCSLYDRVTFSPFGLPYTRSHGTFYLSPFSLDFYQKREFRNMGIMYFHLLRYYVTYGKAESRNSHFFSFQESNDYGYYEFLSMEPKQMFEDPLNNRYPSYRTRSILMNESRYNNPLFDSYGIKDDPTEEFIIGASKMCFSNEVHSVMTTMDYIDFADAHSNYFTSRDLYFYTFFNDSYCNYKYSYDETLVSSNSENGPVDYYRSFVDSQGKYNSVAAIELLVCLLAFVPIFFWILENNRLTLSSSVNTLYSLHSHSSISINVLDDDFNFSHNTTIDVESVLCVMAYQWGWEYSVVLYVSSDSYVLSDVLSSPAPELDELEIEFDYGDFSITEYNEGDICYENIDHAFSNLISSETGVLLSSEDSTATYLSSFDVIHSFALPGLGIKEDCVPGNFTKRVDIFTTDSSVLSGMCSELCGKDHARMPIRIKFVNSVYSYCFYINEPTLFNSSY